MKRFITTFIFFLIFFASISITLDYAISKGLYEMDDYRMSAWSDSQRGALKADILFLGNSRTIMHFDPYIVDSICKTPSYNLGMGGYSINAQLIKFRSIISHNSPPRYIIHNVDYGTLCKGRITNCHESEQFYPLVYDKNLRGELLKNGFGVVNLYLPLARYWGEQRVIKWGLFEYFGLKHYDAQEAYKGYFPDYGTSWNGEELGKIEVIHGEIDNEMCQEFESYLIECKSLGIEVVLVNTPMYSRAVEKVANREIIDSYYNEIADKYDYIYLNYTKDYLFCSDTTNFTVSVHMKKNAAEIFSAAFAHDLNDIINNQKN